MVEYATSTLGFSVKTAAGIRRHLIDICLLSSVIAEELQTTFSAKDGGCTMAKGR